MLTIKQQFLRWKYECFSDDKDFCIRLHYYIDLSKIASFISQLNIQKNWHVSIQKQINTIQNFFWFHLPMTRQHYTPLPKSSYTFVNKTTDSPSSVSFITLKCKNDILPIKSKVTRDHVSTPPVYCVYNS